MRGTLDVRYWYNYPVPGDQFTTYWTLQLIPWHSSSVGVYEARLEPYHHTIIIIPTCQYMPKANVPYVTVTTHYWQFTHQRIATSPYTPYTYNITLNRITTFAHFLKCSAALSWQTIDCYILADLAISILYSEMNDHDTLLQCCYKPSQYRVMIAADQPEMRFKIFYFVMQTIQTSIIGESSLPLTLGPVWDPTQQQWL